MRCTHFSVSPRGSSIPPSKCGAVRRAFIWPVQNMYSLYGRANKHLWRCVHCRRHLMDSREDDVFHIWIIEIDSFDLDDHEEIKNGHRIHPLSDEGQWGAHTLPFVNKSWPSKSLFFFFRCFTFLEYDFTCTNLQALHKGTQPIRLYRPVRIFCCKQWDHAICCMNYMRITHGGYRNRQQWTYAHCRHPLHGL